MREDRRATEELRGGRDEPRWVRKEPRGGREEPRGGREESPPLGNVPSRGEFLPCFKQGLRGERFKHSLKKTQQC